MEPKKSWKDDDDLPIKVFVFIIVPFVVGFSLSPIVGLFVLYWLRG